MKSQFVITYTLCILIMNTAKPSNTTTNTTYRNNPYSFKTTTVKLDDKEPTMRRRIPITPIESTTTVEPTTRPLPTIPQQTEQFFQNQIILAIKSSNQQQVEILLSKISNSLLPYKTQQNIISLGQISAKIFAPRNNRLKKLLHQAYINLPARELTEHSLHNHTDSFNKKN